MTALVSATGKSVEGGDASTATGRRPVLVPALAQKQPWTDIFSALERTRVSSWDRHALKQWFCALPADSQSGKSLRALLSTTDCSCAYQPGPTRHDAQTLRYAVRQGEKSIRFVRDITAEDRVTLELTGSQHLLMQTTPWQFVLRACLAYPLTPDPISQGIRALRKELQHDSAPAALLRKIIAACEAIHSCAQDNGTMPLPQPTTSILVAS